MTPFFRYMCSLSFFHYSEYLVTAIINPHSLSLDSFLLNHSVEYTFAAVSSWVEFIIEKLTVPGWSIQIFDPFCITPVYFNYFHEGFLATLAPCWLRQCRLVMQSVDSIIVIVAQIFLSMSWGLFKFHKLEFFTKTSSNGRFFYLIGKNIN